MKKTYIGITIGPIMRVQNYAKKTRGVWASSYIFSYIAEEIVKTIGIKKIDNTLRVKEIDKIIIDRGFIKPNITGSMFGTNDGVGRFPDQYIFEKKPGDTIQNLREKCDKILDDIAKNMAEVLELSNEEDIIKKYLKHNIRIIIIEREFDVIDEASYNDENTLRNDILKQNATIISDMQETMNIMECRDMFCAEETRNYLAEYIESGSPQSTLIKDGFGDKRGNLFDTVIECTTCGEFIGIDANGNEIEQDRTDLIRGRKDSLLKPYHKYIAIVSADGDNFGKTLAKFGDSVAGIFIEINDGIKQKVENYGGQVIYQGGDDLFFFAPIYNLRLNKDIFGLIKDIDTDIQNAINRNDILRGITDVSKRPSFSYGVSISYHKFPIVEARQKAEELLKSIKSARDGIKNKIKWSVRKHSGQTFGGIVNKNNNGEFEDFLSLVENVNSGRGFKENFLHSVTYWLASDETMLSFILLNRKREELLKNYIHTKFNEDYAHDIYSPLFEKIHDYLIRCEGDSGIMKLHFIMRYISLLLKD